METNFKLVLCDFSEGLCEEWKKAFNGYPEVEVKYGRFEDVNFDCINSAGNSFGLMDGGVDEAISMFFGPQLEKRVQKMIIDKYAGEQPVGTSEIIQASSEKAARVRYLSHTPTMIIPEIISNKDNVYMAMKAMLLSVQTFNENNEFPIKTLVCTGLGTGAGKVPFAKAAKDMAKAYNSFKFRPNGLSWEFAVERYEQIKSI